MNVMVQAEFRPAVAEATAAAAEHFGSAVAGVYLGGSVAFGEAWPGVSDVDWFAFLDREPTEEDIRWSASLATRLTREHDAVGLFAVNLNSVDRLRRESIWRFILRYNSVRLSGRDLIAELEDEGIKTPVPGPALARSRVGWLENLVKATAAGQFSEVVFKLPENPSLATRKLARWLVLVEGAHVLMGDDGFVSFRQEDVLCQLERFYPRWASLFQTTRDVLKDPFSTTTSPYAFTQDAVAFLRWGVERIRTRVRTRCWPDSEAGGRTIKSGYSDHLHRKIGTLIKGTKA